MSREIDAREAIGLAVLGIVILAILVGISCAGLFALYLAKLHEDRLADHDGPVLYPIFIATGMTAVIYAGSAASGVLGSFADMHEGICRINHLVDDRIACHGSRFGRGGVLMDQRHYFMPLFTHYAVPFWIELTVALYAVRFAAVKKRLITVLSPQDYAKRMKIANAAILALTFALGSSLGGHYRFGALGCDPIGPVCRAANNSAFALFGFVVGKAATIVDAWVMLPRTIATSLGNQFKLAELAPVIFAVWCLVRIHQDAQYRGQLIAKLRGIFVRLERSDFKTATLSAIASSKLSTPRLTAHHLEAPAVHATRAALKPTHQFRHADASAGSPRSKSARGFGHTAILDSNVALAFMSLTAGVISFFAVLFWLS